MLRFWHQTTETKNDLTLGGRNTMQYRNVNLKSNLINQCHPINVNKNANC